MTILTVEIDKKEDLSNLTEYFNRLGLRYEVGEDKNTSTPPKIVHTNPTSSDMTDFQKLLLTGPVMDDKQYEEYKTLRKRFNKWRTK